MDNINAMMRLKIYSIGGTLYKYTEYGTRSVKIRPQSFNYII
ncbi:hypothetical protein [Acidiplasma sp.]